jgi:hypothetical protein
LNSQIAMLQRTARHPHGGKLECGGHV